MTDVLDQRGIEHSYPDGGNTIQRFFRERLVDERIIPTIPVLIGGGLPLFGPLENDVKLELI